MKRLVIGILAHVDAGKTTLSEALLYAAGTIQKLGRVDHRDSYLDTHALERARGITIFSKQAVFETPDLSVTLLDTPGHVDFSAEMERTLQVLDYAILVISGTDGVQAHTETLWRLLRRNQIPTFVFVTKMDLPTAGHEDLMADLRKHLDEGCVDFTHRGEDWEEAIALREEALLDKYLEDGSLSTRDISGLIRIGRLFPVFFGAALKMEGVDPPGPCRLHGRARLPHRLRRPGLQNCPGPPGGTADLSAAHRGPSQGSDSPPLLPPPRRETPGGEGHPAPAVLRGQV